MTTNAAVITKSDTRPTVAVAPLTPSAGVLTLRGYGIRVSVHHGHLFVEDGVGTDRRCGLFSRVSPGFQRLILIGYTGYISLEATRWLADLGITFAHLDPTGRVLGVAGCAGVRDPRVTRGQALAADTGVGLAVTRELLAAKVEGQAIVSERLPGVDPDLSAYLRSQAALVERADSIPNACYIESQSADAFWAAWSAVSTTFTPRDERRVPGHWLAFGRRQSPVSRKNGQAVNPANALLNYLYAILEAEARLALIAVGCDPLLGVIHADRMSRDSLALDVMEPVRPHVDAYVLDLLATQVFTRQDFFEGRNGVAKLMPAITLPLSETALRWAQLVAPVAERVASTFARSLTRRTREGIGARRYQRTALDEGRLLRTPLTNRNSRPPSAHHRRGDAAHHSASAGVPSPVSALPARCQSCGAKLTAPRRKYCDTCLAAAPGQSQAEGARSATARRKAAGIADGRSAIETKANRWRMLVAREAEHREWDTEHGAGPDRDVFLKEITPLLKSIPIDVLVTATGLSKPMCYRIRRGQGVPHWRHWDTIRTAVAEHRPPRKKDWERFAATTYEDQIAPTLRTLSTVVIRAATGWSESYVSLVRHGHYVPHRRHWAALLRLVERRDVPRMSTRQKEHRT